MKDTNAPAAFMIFLMAIVALVLLNDLTGPQTDEPTEVLANELVPQSAESDLVTSDDFE